MPADPAAAGVSPAPARARVFFALWPSAALAAQLTAIARQFAEVSGGRPSRQETLHLTLAFLGEVAETRLPELCRAASAVHAPAFELQIDRLDFWSHNRLLWGGCSVPPPALGKLVDALRGALLGAGFGLAEPARHFVPHVSLVRRVPISEAPAAFREQTLSLPAWPCMRFVLVRSSLSAAGADYRVLAEFPLTSDAPR